MWRLQSAVSTKPAWTIFRSRLECKTFVERVVALAGLVLVLALLGARTTFADTFATNAGLSGTSCRTGSMPMARVELYFGSRLVDGRAWRRFLASVVTPRFPDGLTSLEGIGQWRGQHGLEREPAHILVIFYKLDGTSDARIEAIRTLYKDRFHQRSVLRADAMACVDF